jgi:ABC-type nitrate/sulfonate/bicarbonate transport system substrate-binding protein
MLNAKHLAILILALSLVVAGCAAPTAAPTPKPTKVTMLLDWTPNTNHTGLYVAKAKGWYAEQGLDVDIIQPGEGGTPVQLIAADKGDFGISFQEEVTHARATDIPVISIGAIIQHNTSGFASVKDKNITQPKGFEGKKYGAFGLPIEQQVLDVLMKCDGGDVNKVTFVDIGASDPLMAIQREMDFV